MEVDTKTGIIYCWRNVHNGKRYIGQTIDPQRRYREHKRYLGNYAGQNLFGRALNKYSSMSDWEYTIIEEVSKEMLDEREIYWIEFYDSMNPECGYNIREGGHNIYGYKLPEETRRKQSESHKGKPAWNKGRKHTPETLKKLSEAKKGKKLSEEAKKKISEANRGHSHPHDETSRKKISAANKGKKRSAETKKRLSFIHNPNRIAIYQNDTLITICDTVKEAACLTDVSHAYVQLIVSGKWSKTKSGYSFKYISKSS